MILHPVVSAYLPTSEPCVCPRDPCRRVTLNDRFFTSETGQTLCCGYMYYSSTFPLHAAIGDEQPTLRLSHACTMHARSAARCHGLVLAGKRRAVGSSSMHDPPLNGTSLHTITHHQRFTRLLKMLFDLD